MLAEQIDALALPEAPLYVVLANGGRTQAFGAFGIAGWRS